MAVDSLCGQRDSAGGMCRMGGWLVVLGCVALLGRPVLAGDLSAGQQKLLDEATSYVKQAETNLKLAQDTAGKGEGRPTGSKAKLAMVRLNTARQPLENARVRLEKLPADNDAVAALQKQFDAVEAGVNKLYERLTGEAPAATDAQADAGVKLDYRQEEQLKNGQFHLRDVQGKLAAVQQIVGQVQAVEDQNRINYRTIRQAMETIRDAHRKAKNAQDALDNLPPDGRGVKAFADGLAKANADLAAVETVLVPLNEKLTALVDPANYPNLKADVERVQELSRMYALPADLTNNRPQAAEAIRQAQAASAERDRLVKTYAYLILQQTAEGKRVEGTAKGFKDNYEAFSAEAMRQKAALPGEIDKELADIRKMGDDAVAAQKPLWFTGGIPQHMGWAEDRIALLEVLDAEAGKAAKAKLEQTREDLRKQQASLRDAIINANELPPDRYAGADRDALVKLAIETWKQRDPKAEVLTSRIPAQEWKRSVSWTFLTDTWYKTDKSKLQVQLIVRHDDKLAAIEPINLSKDHLSNDAIKAYPFHDKGEELEAQNLMLLEKVK